LSPYESYCTLGAYLSPSGDSKVASTILRKKAVKQSSQVSKEAALWSHVLYLQPKLTFPIIAMTLTEAQYLHIPSPAIMAILPKLHLNHHTARSIVHGPLHYGGLGLPHSYSSQGLGPLKFLLGYLRAQDKTCKLILICHGYLQHLLRISTNLLNSSYQSLHTLACPTWLVSAWKFMSRLWLTVHIKTAGLLPSLCGSDINLMDYFITQNYWIAQLEGINQCQVYLQLLLSLSDILLEDGQCIMAPLLNGHHLIYRHSTLHWPSQCNPSKTDWGT
jgi:hypothetical protein